MGQKVNPHGLRVGIIKDWDSRWYAEKDFADNLVEDDKIRKYIKNRLYSAGISRTEIERASDRVKIIIHTAKPGIVIGRGGSAIDELKKELEKLTGKKLIIEIKEVKRFDVDKDAQLVAENIAQQLENRISFRRAMKSCMQRTMRNGALGIKTSCSGRLAELIWPVQSSTAREQFHCRHLEQILIMVSLKLTQLMEKLVLKFGYTMVKYFLQRKLRKGAINNVNA
jgi:small subunit ribosomal protein S3